MLLIAGGSKWKGWRCKSKKNFKHSSEEETFQYYFSNYRKDVGLPTDMQRSFAAEAEADREAKAKLISAEGEQRASRKLKEAADVMDESPATLQLRYLQTLNTISSENNHTYVFPLPLDLLGKLFGMKQ